MAVFIEGYSVVVRNSTLDAKYPGGVEAYRRDCPNTTFCADERLSRIGFMALDDANVFVAQLAAKGLTPHQRGVAEDVAFVTVDGPPLPCSWLEVGQWSRITIAWLAGTEKGDFHAPAGWSADRSVRHMSVEEIQQKLEFVRTGGSVDVYRDKTTGQEYYVGRTRPTSEQDRARHNDLYRQACGLIEGLIILDNKVPGNLDASALRRLEDAIKAFVEVVQINPGNWNAMWLLGKIYQRLGQYDNGLQWFARAHRTNPDQPDVAREAAIAAMDLGRPDEAVPICERAIEASPEDPGLRANLALALVFSGKPSEAKGVGQDALKRNPSDGITKQIVGIIDDVLAGRRTCPHHIRDLQ